MKKKRDIRLKSNVSDEIDGMAIKPAVKLTDSTEGRSLYLMSARVENILRNQGMLRKSDSDPEITTSLLHSLKFLVDIVITSVSYIIPY